MNERADGYIILYALSDYICVMTEAEILLILNGRMKVNKEMVDRWERLLLTQRAHKEEIIKSAYAKQR